MTLFQKAALSFMLLEGLFSCGFPFDKDMTEHLVIGNYYILSVGSANSLNYKDPGALGARLIAKEIDSIGWHENIILAVQKNNLIVDSASKKILNIYNGRIEMMKGMKSNCSEFDLKSVTDIIRN